MRNRVPTLIPIWVGLSMLLPGCGSLSGTQSGVAVRHPLTTLAAAQGGTIVFGTVDQADTPGKAMARVLDDMARSCGEKPKVGRVFHVQGGGSTAVFFTVTNHPAGNKQVAGMLLAAATSPQTIDAALVSDDAARFPRTMNPMLKQLFAVWHPYPAGPAQPAAAVPAARTGMPAPPLRQVANSDHSASVGLPPGWSLDPRSGGGQVLVHGPGGELAGFNLSVMAQNTNDPSFQRNLRMGIRMTRVRGMMYWPYSPNVAQNIENLYKEWKRSLGQQPPALQVDSVRMMQGSSVLNTAYLRGRVDPDGRGAQSLELMMGVGAPGVMGSYRVHITFSQIPVGLLERDQGTIAAIANSVNLNQKVIGGEVQAATQVGIQMAHQYTGEINQIGANTSARIQSEQQQHDAQLQGWYAEEDQKSRSNQQFDNYILDRTVVQDNNMFNNGTIGHGTLSDSEADWLVKNYPNRFEYVDKPNYWEGTDYHW